MTAIRRPLSAETPHPPGLTPSRMNQVVVLGASGLIGTAVMRELAPQTIRLRAVSRTATAELPRHANSRIERVQADLLEPGEVAHAVADADVIIHLAAYAASGSTWRSATIAPDAERVNVGLMHDIVSALRDRSTVPALIYASTAQAANPIQASQYARQKIEAETILRQATAEGIVNGVILRLPVIYGQTCPAGPIGRGIVSAMIQRALSGESITMWNDGHVLRNLLHVEDVAAAFISALNHRRELAGGTWSLSADRSESLSTIFSTIADSVAHTTGTAPVSIVSVPSPEDAEANDFRSDEFNSAEFRALTGWRPRVPLSEGITRTVATLILSEEPSCGSC